MSTHIRWDEAKRQANLDKHGLDFTDAPMVLESPYRLDVGSVRSGEASLPARGASFQRLADIVSRIVPGDRERFHASVAAALADPHGLFSGEYRIRRADGAIRWRSDRGTVERSANGRPLRLVGISLDITDHKQHEDRISLQMREVSHRAKNLLAVVQAVANRTARSGDRANFPERFGERLRGMAASHDLLVNSNWEGVELGELARRQLAHFTDLAGTRIVMHGPRVRINAAAAQALGMALHELATNASKYGALVKDTGQVTITWSEDERGGERRFTMRWQETGGPRVMPPRRKGFGHTVIVRMAEASVNGKSRLAFRPGGVVWDIEASSADVIETPVSSGPEPPPR